MENVKHVLNNPHQRLKTVCVAECWGAPYENVGVAFTELAQVRGYWYLLIFV